MSDQGTYEKIYEAGLRLAATPEAEGGWCEYFAESDQGDLRMEDDILRSQTALMLENSKRWLAAITRSKIDSKGRVNINEATRAALVGGFSDYLYPIVRAGFPTNIANDLVSVQPTTRRTSTIIYWNWVVGSGKGSYAPGQRLFDANRGKQDIGYNFSNEVIDVEVVATGTGSSAVITGTLQFHDGGGVRPGTVVITASLSSTLTSASDNGNGGWTGGLSGSINYATGVFSITFGSNVDAQPVTATYRWDSEGSLSVPQVDVQIVTSTVETERRALILNYSMESVFDVMNELGVALEPSLVSGAAEQMNYEISRQIISELFQLAPVVQTFQISAPSAGYYNQQDHFKDLVIVLNAASNSIQRKTMKAYGNWIVVDNGAANVIESLPAGMFVAAPRPSNINGPHFIGTLLGRYRVYKDLLLDQEVGAASAGNILMGYKGSQFYEAGYVWSPYQMMYTTDPLTTANMVTQKGMASRYATKVVNAAMYVRISLTA